MSIESTLAGFAEEAIPDVLALLKALVTQRDQGLAARRLRMQLEAEAEDAAIDAAIQAREKAGG